MTLLVDILRSFPFMSKVNLSEALGGSFELPPNFFSEHNFPRKPAFRFNQCIRFIGLSLGFLMHSGERRSRKMLLNLRQNLDQLQKDDVTEMSDTRLFTHLRNLFQRCCQITGDRSYAASILGAVGVGFGCVMLLFRLTRRWLRDDDGRIANRLISGAGGMDSAEAGFALGRLAGFARQYPSVKTSIMETDNFAKIEEMLQSTADGKEFLRHWQNFMDRHGHHTRGEIDVYNRRWREIPDYILSLLKSFLNAKDQNDLIQRKDELQKQRQEILTNCLRQLRNPVKRWVFTLVLFKAQQGLTVRENCKSEFVRMISIIRQSLLEVGSRLQKKGVFGEITDLFFLNDSELFSVLSGNVPVGIGEIIYSRKNEFGHHQKLKPPSTITGPFDCAVNSCEEIYEQIQELKGLAVSPGVAEGCPMSSCMRI